jgi:hypothetical protein
MRSNSAPPNNNRQIIEVSAGANATTIQTAINSAVAFRGQRPVVHLPAGSYSIASTLVIPASLDVQIIGDGSGTQLNWTGGAGAAMFQLSSPSKARLQDFHLWGGLKAEGILIGTEDAAGSRIQIDTMVVQEAQQGLVVELFEQRRINLYAHSGYNASSSSSPYLNVTGTGSPSYSAVAFFAATFASYQSAPVISVTGNANVLIKDLWNEKNSRFADISRSAGNITIDCDLLAPTTPSSNIVTINGFAGNLAWLSYVFNNGGQNPGPVSVTNPNANTNVLFMGETTSWFNRGRGRIGPWRLAVMSTAGEFRISGRRGTNTRSRRHTKSSFHSVDPWSSRTILPSLNTSTPSGVTDVQISKVFMQSPTNAIHVKTGI